MISIIIALASACWPTARRIGLLAPLLVTLLLLGCQPHTKSLSYNLQKMNGIVTMTVGDLTIDFEGLRDDSPGVTQVGGTFHVYGPISGSGKGHMLEYVNSGGEVDFTVAGDYVFKITNEGTRLTYSGRSYAIGDGPTKMTIGKDGTVRVDDFE